MNHLIAAGWMFPCAVPCVAQVRPPGAAPPLPRPGAGERIGGVPGADGRRRMLELGIARAGEFSRGPGLRVGAVARGPIVPAAATRAASPPTLAAVGLRRRWEAEW